MTRSMKGRLLISTATLTGAVLVLYLILARPFAAEGTPYIADFGRAGQGLGPGSPVEVRGVPVGTVSALRLGEDGRAHLTLRLNHGVRVPDTATAAIVPASVFGPKFVDLRPGTGEAAGPYLAAGARIGHTADPTDLSDLLATADGAATALNAGDVATIVHTLAVGLGGEGPDLRATLVDTTTLTAVAYRHRADARSFLHDVADLSGTAAAAAPTAVQAAGDTEDLVTAVASAGQGSLGAFAANLGGLSALIAHGLDKRGGQIGDAFRSSERLVALLYDQLGMLPGAVKAGNLLLPVYGGITRLPGPGGKHYLGIQAYLPRNPCELILGLCGSSGRR